MKSPKRRRKGGKGIGPNLQIGAWNLVKRLGKGGQGEVWEVKHAVTKHVPPRAMKLCFTKNRKQQERFEREVDLLSNCKHENVIELLDHDLSWATYGAVSPISFYVMPKAVGALSDSQWARDTLLLLKFFRQVCYGLKYLHSKPEVVLHRDMKPKNILILGPEHPRAVLADLGIAVEEDLQGEETETQEVVGSFRYRAPEIYNGAPGTVASDVYGLGRILQRILTGLEPEGVDPQEVPRKVRQLSATAADALDNVISRATAHSPGKRFQAVSELLKALPDLGIDIVKSASPKVKLVGAMAKEVGAPGQSLPPGPIPGNSEAMVADEGPVGTPVMFPLNPGDFVGEHDQSDSGNSTKVSFVVQNGGFAYLSLTPLTILPHLARLTMNELVRIENSPLRCFGPLGTVWHSHNKHGGTVFEASSGDQKTARTVSLLQPNGTIVGVHGMFFLEDERRRFVSFARLEKSFGDQLESPLCHRSCSLGVLS